MKKETIFRHEINESIQANVALNCLKNRNNHKQLKETADFDARFEFRKDLRELASPIAKKAYMIIRKQYGDNMWRQLGMDDCDEQGLIDMLNMYAETEQNPQKIVNKMMGVREDEEESYTAYDDTDGVWMIINLMRKMGMLRAQGIEGRDDVDDGHAIDKAYDLIEQKLNEEGMWIDDDHEAERFVSFFGDEIAAEAMKSALHNQEQEELTVEQEEMPQMERRDMILALSEYMSESWIDTGDDGDLDDIYYAIADILDNTGDYPASTDWKDCKPWCQKHYREVEAKIY